ncbi:glycosyltransferase family 87 protein [Asticcacaulis taihuensis]|uniref:glycosyltransferase family 87 protein n=1 Tax=Asticcacaulis taihuensis TaxID=260084 RepID=UPI003F7B57D5
MSPVRLTDALRRADWLNGERGRVYSLMGLVAFLLMALLFWLRFAVFAPGPDPLGGDFTSFYAASKLALSGHPADAWNPAAHAHAEDSLFRGPHDYLAFFYPPPYLLLCWPLALLPYGWAALAWMTGTAALATALLRAFFRRVRPEGPMPLVVMLAFPALWINIGCGQNGAVTLAILTGGFLMMDRRPIVAGLILGLMIIKPQLAIGLPFVLGGAALAEPKRWKVFFATGISALALCGIAWLALGTAGYAAFFTNSAYAREVLNQGLVDPALMQSLYAGLRMLGASMTAAYAAQGALSLTVLAMASYTAFRYRPTGLALGALTISATVLTTPFLLDYDLLVTALPLGWLVLTGAKHGFRNWEKLLLLMVFLLPLAARKLALVAHLPMAPLLLLIVFAFVIRRIRTAETVPVAMPAACAA